MWSGGSLSPALAAALVAGFSVDQDSWDYSSSENLDFLREGETITFSYAVVATDDSGAANAASAAQTVTITITGTNDQPTLTDTTDPAAVLELTNASAQDLSAIAGTFAVSDVDVGDTLTASVIGSPVVELDGVAFALPAGALALTAAGAFTLAGSISNGGSTSIGYSYDPGAANLDFLRSGQSLTISYVVKVNDGTTDSGTQNLTFTITGTNDAPVLSAAAMPVLASVAEDAGPPIGAVGNLVSTLVNLNRRPVASTT